MRRVGQRIPTQTRCNAHMAPLCKSSGGHLGVRHCCSRHHKGHPQLVPVAGGALERKLSRLGAGARPAPPPLEGGGGGSEGDNVEGATQGLGTAPAPRGRFGGPRRCHGRAKGVDPGRPVPPSRCGTRCVWGVRGTEVASP